MGPSHYWGWACSMLGCTAQLHISPAATPLLAWDRCWVLPAGAVCSGCSHSVLQSILLCANPTAWPCSCSGAAPCAPVSLYEHWGGGGNEPEGDAGSSCSWGSPSLVCLHRQCPMEHTGTGCPTGTQPHCPTASRPDTPARPSFQYNLYWGDWSGLNKAGYKTWSSSQPAAGGVGRAELNQDRPPVPVPSALGSGAVPGHRLPHRSTGPIPSGCCALGAAPGSRQVGWEGAAQWGPRLPQPRCPGGCAGAQPPAPVLQCSALREHLQIMAFSFSSFFF